MKRLVLILMATAATPVVADNGADDGTDRRKTVDCYCTDRSGARVELGETICLHVDGRSFMAQCQMSLNNPMWREVGQGCLSSFLREGLQPVVDAPGVDAEIGKPEAQPAMDLDSLVHVAHGGVVGKPEHP